MLASVSEFDCFLRSRCSMEMWCPDDMGRDSWDWVGPPAWVRACSNSPDWGGGSSPVKTEPPQIVLLLLLCVVVCCCVLLCVVVCCCVLLCVVVCCVLCVVCCFTVSLFFNACYVTTKLAPDAPSPRRNKTKLGHAESHSQRVRQYPTLLTELSEQWAQRIYPLYTTTQKTSNAKWHVSATLHISQSSSPCCNLGLISHSVKSSNITFNILGCSESSSSLPSLECEAHILQDSV